MNAEHILRTATAQLDSTKFHRIDRLRDVSGLEAHEFDSTVKDLARQGRIELTGGDTSTMSDSEINALIMPENELFNIPFVNIVWITEREGGEEMDDWLGVMMDNLETVMETYRSTGGSTRETYELLTGYKVVSGKVVKTDNPKGRIPGFDISLSQFKPYMKAVAKTHNYLTVSDGDAEKKGGSGMELNTLQLQVSELSAENATLKSKLSDTVKKANSYAEKARSEISRLRQELTARPAPYDMNTPEGQIKAAGWSPAKSGRYWRAFRKYQGKNIGVHIGKELTFEAFRDALLKKAGKEKDKDMKRFLSLES